MSRRRSLEIARIWFAALAIPLCLPSVSYGQPTFQVVTAFDAAFPGVGPSGVIQAADGSFYGTTCYGGANGSGTVFRIDNSGTLTTLLSFTGGTDGAFPCAGVLQAADGSFYGTTTWGGASDKGTVFKLDGAGTLTTLHSFTGAAGEGAYPVARVIQATDGSFYGTTIQGGASNFGTVYKIDGAGTLTTLHGFTGGSEGADPGSALIQATDGSFYGTTAMGGPNNFGTVFKLDGAGALTTLHSFTGDGEGTYPSSGVIQATDGSFYGTTMGAGENSVGSTVFKLDGAGIFTTIHSFTFDVDGANPVGGVIEATDGSFYGTTAIGGPNNFGTVFKLDAAGTLTTVHNFAALTDGESPATELIQALDGGLYGTTSSGGENGGGTLYRLGATVPTTTTLYALPASAGYLQPVYLIAVVAPVAPAIGVPTGLVRFWNGSIFLGEGVLSSGVAYIAAGGLAPGTHSITASYLGGGIYAGSVPAPATVTIQPPEVSTFTFLIPLTNPQSVGQPVVLAALVVRLGAGTTPTGFVQFLDNGVVIGTAAIGANGVAAFSTTTLAAGTHPMAARYVGNGTLSPSRSPFALQTVYAGSRPVSTTVALTSIGPDPWGTVIFTAIVTGASSGNVVFISDGLVIGTVPVANAGGTFTAELPRGLATGVHVVTAHFVGGAGTAASNSSPVVVVIPPGGA